MAAANACSCLRALPPTPAQLLAQLCERSGVTGDHWIAADCDDTGDGNGDAVGVGEAQGKRAGAAAGAGEMGEVSMLLHKLGITADEVRAERCIALLFSSSFFNIILYCITYCIYIHI